MQRPGAAERDEREVARIVAALDRDDAQRAEHLRVHDVDHRLRIDVAERALGRRAIEHEAARELGREAPEQQIRIGDGRAAARAVTRGAWMCAGRLGTDAYRAAGVARHERAAARADRVQVDGRQPDRKAADDALGHARCPATRQQADVGRRSAHVERDRVLEAGPPRDEVRRRRRRPQALRRESSRDAPPRHRSTRRRPTTASRAARADPPACAVAASARR